MLRGLGLLHDGLAALAHVLQRAGDLLILHAVVAALLVDRREARELQPLGAGAQHDAAVVCDLDLLRLVHGVRHLAGDEAQVHQPVQVELVARQRRLDVLRAQVDAGGPDGIMRILRALAALVDHRLLRHILRAVAAFNRLARRGNGLVGQAHAVGTDVGDQAQRAAALDVHALVELLGDLHGLARGEAQLAAGLLLQVRGGERRSRMLVPLAALDAFDHKAAPGDARLGVVGRLLVR